MSFDDHEKKSISELIAPFKTAVVRYWRIAWAPAFAIFALITVISVKIPDYFVSDVLIYIQPQKISSELVKAPERDEQQERFEALIQELLSRPRLRSIIDRFDLYPEHVGVIGKELAMEQLREDIRITPVTSPSGKALVQTFRVAYRHNDANLAFEVTKALSNLFIEESIISQRSETQGTEEFIDSQLRDARKRLEVTEAKVQEFVRRNAGKLPEHKDEAMARLTNAQQQLANNAQLIAANVARLQYLQQELKLATSLPAAQGGDTTATQGGSLAQLEQALTILTSKYSDKHPDVINTKKRIALLRKNLKNGGADLDEDSLVGMSPVARTLRTQVNEIKVQIQQLRSENEQLKKVAGTLDSEIKAMPLKQQELTQISRDYTNVRESYERLLAAKEEASLQSSLVRSQKSSQFRIVDPPSKPVVPAGPPRLIVAAAGVFAGIAAFLLIPIALFFLNDSYKFRGEVEDELGVPVIGVIPPMSTPAAVVAGRRAGATSMLASVVSMIAGSVIIFLAL